MDQQYTDTSIWKYDSAKEAFTTLASDGKIYAYIDLPTFRSMPVHMAQRRTKYVERIVSHCARINVGGMLPRLRSHNGMNDDSLQTLKGFYKRLLKCAESSSVSVGFALEHAYGEYVLRRMQKERATLLASSTLVMYEYLCDADCTVKYRLHGEGDLMSLVAFDDEKFQPETIDLRHLIKDGMLVWDPETSGNWRILEFVCVRDERPSSFDILSYDASLNFLEKSWELFCEELTPYVGTTLTALEYHDIAFDAPNRRSWTPQLNATFEAMYGFDPAPLYPALFRNIGPETMQIRSLFFNCRAKLMQNGFLRAASDFAAQKKLSLLGSVAEPKLTASPWITGDNLLNGIYSPGALMDKAYLYGTNSVKIAAAAAYNFDRERVSCELYRNYCRASKNIFSNDAMNALARGANLMMVHIPLLEEQEHRKMMRSLLASHWESEFSNYIGRIQTLLSGGRHVADIALLYPIYDICAKTAFYTSPAGKFEYPNAPASADYMNVINGISTYAGHDLTVLHPETLEERCYTEKGILYLKNERNYEQFSILILPAADLISLQNLRKVAAFYDQGGKVIATGILPSLAFEYEKTAEDSPRRRRTQSANDKEVCALVRHIFGDDAYNPYIVRPFFHNENENGGEAYFLPFTSTAADGTCTTKSKMLSEAIDSFGLPLDIYIPEMPRLECIGALNSVYPEFEALGLARAIPGGGMVNHIHKKRGNCDIYYFSNTTNGPLKSDLLLRGVLYPEEWNPYTGEAQALAYSRTTIRNTDYTRISVQLPPSGSILIISDPDRKREAESTENHN